MGILDYEQLWQGSRFQLDFSRWTLYYDLTGTSAMESMTMTLFWKAVASSDGQGGSWNSIFDVHNTVQGL